MQDSIFLSFSLFFVFISVTEAAIGGWSSAYRSDDGSQRTGAAAEEVVIARQVWVQAAGVVLLQARHLRQRTEEQRKKKQTNKQETKAKTKTKQNKTKNTENKAKQKTKELSARLK